eukprot:4244806-Prymnesium_polylepis.1
MPRAAPGPPPAPAPSSVGTCPSATLVRRPEATPLRQPRPRPRPHRLAGRRQTQPRCAPRACEQTPIGRSERSDRATAYRICREP